MRLYAVFSHKKSSFRQIAPYRNKNYPYFLGQPLINTFYGLPVLIKETLIQDLSLSLSLPFSRHPVVGESSPVVFISLVWPGTKYFYYNHGQKSWVSFSLLGRFLTHTCPASPLIPQTTLDACIQKFFPSFNFVESEGGRTTRTFRKGSTVL